MPKLAFWGSWGGTPPPKPIKIIFFSLKTLQVIFLQHLDNIFYDYEDIWKLSQFSITPAYSGPEMFFGKIFRCVQASL